MKNYYGLDESNESSGSSERLSPKLPIKKPIADKPSDETRNIAPPISLTNTKATNYSKIIETQSQRDGDELQNSDSPDEPSEDDTTSGQEGSSQSLSLSLNSGPISTQDFKGGAVGNVPKGGNISLEAMKNTKSYNSAVQYPVASVHSITISSENLIPKTTITFTENMVDGPYSNTVTSAQTSSNQLSPVAIKQNAGSVKRLSQKLDGHIPLGLAAIAGPPRSNSQQSDWPDISNDDNEPTNEGEGAKHAKVIDKTQTGRYVTLVSDESASGLDPLAAAALAEHTRRSGRFSYNNQSNKSNPYPNQQTSHKSDDLPNSKK